MSGLPKPMGSLSSGLLARKGQARPAMRPQGMAGFASLSHAGDALGWNDMGEAPVAKPPVLAERETLKQEIETPAPTLALTPMSSPEPVAKAPVAMPVAMPVSVRTAERLRRETTHKTRAAFTLRLDEDRHLRLRLAAATDGRSAQQIVTEALDRFLETMPEVEALVAQLPPRKQRRTRLGDR